MRSALGRVELGHWVGLLCAVDSRDVCARMVFTSCCWCKCCVCADGLEAGRGRLRGGLLRAGRQGFVMARDGWLPRFEREAASKFTTTKIFSLQK